jgi:peptidoglycan/xylan/chitin deacetylase (PgdA/CDA1 family)
VRSRVRAALRRTLARVASLGRKPEEGLRVLTYHRVNDVHPLDRLTVTPHAFGQQMERLFRSGQPVVALDRVLDALRGAAALPPGAVALTFDDGFGDNRTEALPVLERFGFPATFFVVTGLMGGRATLDRYRGCCEADRMLRWDEVRDLRARGHAIGGHGRTHRELATLSLEDARGEAAGCALDIEEQVGERPRLFCYPRGSESVAVRRVVGEAGYEAACTVRPGPNPRGTEPLALRRTEVSGSDTLEDFDLKLAGGFDAWHALVQRALGARHP